jgi:hypothetical protein
MEAELVAETSYSVKSQENGVQKEDCFTKSSHYQSPADVSLLCF